MQRPTVEAQAQPQREGPLAVDLEVSAVASVGAASVLTKPSQAQPPTDNQNRGATSQQFGIDTTIGGDDCTGEEIHVTGTVHFVERYYETDGGYHFRIHYNLVNAKGVGLTSGEEYIITSAGGTAENVVPAGSLVRNTVDLQLIVGKGQADNLVAHSLLHYVIEVVDGEPTVKMEKIEIFTKCQG
jgi:hypothetical protein